VVKILHVQNCDLSSKFSHLSENVLWTNEFFTKSWRIYVSLGVDLVGMYL
jgi:hypothetical protein